MQKEIFKDIPNYEGLYKVSNLGSVKSLKYSKEIILKPENNRGYFRYTLSKNNIKKRILAHRLVAKLFLNNEENKPCVNHIDGNKFNNNVSNLEWCTYSENEKHSYDVLNKLNHNRKLSNKAILDIRNNACKGGFPFNNDKGNISLFMSKYNVSRKTVLNVLNNKYYV